MAVPTFVVNFLPLTNHAQIAVIQGHYLDRGVVLQAGREFLNAHLDRALSRYTEHFSIRLGQLDAHGVRDANAHGPKPTRIDPSAWLVKPIVLSRPHLVLSNVGGDVSFNLLGQVPKRFDDILRFDHVTLAKVVLQAVALAPCLYGVPPGSQSAGVRPHTAFLDHHDHF